MFEGDSAPWDEENKYEPYMLEVIYIIWLLLTDIQCSCYYLDYSILFLWYCQLSQYWTHFSLLLRFILKTKNQENFAMLKVQVLWKKFFLIKGKTAATCTIFIRLSATTKTLNI